MPKNFRNKLIIKALSLKVMLSAIKFSWIVYDYIDDYLGLKNGETDPTRLELGVSAHKSLI